MTDAYEFDISRATTGADLNALTDAFMADEQLSPEDREQLNEAVSARFGQLNWQAAQANGPAKGRWN